MANEAVAIDEANEIAKFRNGKSAMANNNETFEQVCEEMKEVSGIERFINSHYCNNCGEHIDGEGSALDEYSDRLLAARKREIGELDKLRGCNLILNSQIEELTKLLNSAKTAIREVQDRMNHDGTAIGVFKSYWRILEAGFNGTYRYV